jgi:uncharacterized protein (TIGR03437 family)
MIATCRWFLVVSFVLAASAQTVTDFAHPSRPHVMVKNSFALPTQLDQFFPLKQRLGAQPLLVVLMEFSDSQHKSGHDAAYFRDILYGADPSVNGYYREISYGKFSFSDAAILGWCTAPKTAAYYFSDTQTDSQYQKLGYEAVRCAIAAGQTFRKYDTSGDGKVGPEELLVLMVLADHPAAAFPNIMATREVQTQTRGVVTGENIEVDTLAVRVEENVGVEGSTRKGFYVSYYSHELAHAALSLPDLYSDTFGEDPSDYMTVMATSGVRGAPHLDPWAKIHLGWIKPVVVARSGWYAVKSVEKNPEAYILYKPAHGVNEYFIIENRWPPDSFYEMYVDNPNFYDRGLAVWHITEFYDDEPFDFNRGRKTIGMKWAGGSQAMTVYPRTALWDSSQRDSAYDWNDTSTPRNSHWASGEASGISMTRIPAAGPQVQVYFGVGPETGPTITAAGIVSSASGRTGAIAPGELVSVWGTGVGPPTWTSGKPNDAGFFETTLAETRVWFGSVAAPVTFVRDVQINAAVPYAVAGRPTVNVQVEYRGTRSEAIPIQVADAAPGIFTLDASGGGPAALFNEDGTLNTPQNPAGRGKIVVFYATGEGETNPPGVDGKLCAGQCPKPRLPVSIRIGGKEAQPIYYAGGVYGIIAGLIQVNVKVPDDAPTGDAVELTLMVGDKPSRTGVTLAIKP